MQRSRKLDFKSLIEKDVAPSVEPQADAERAPAPAPVVEAAPAAVTPAVKAARPRLVPQDPKGQGTLKQRAKQLTVYLEDPVYEQLRELAHAERTKLHPLILEGIDLLLKKRGMKSIRELMKAS